MGGQCEDESWVFYHKLGQVYEIKEEKSDDARSLLRASLQALYNSYCFWKQCLDIGRCVPFILRGNTTILRRLRVLVFSFNMKGTHLPMNIFQNSKDIFTLSGKINQ